MQRDQVNGTGQTGLKVKSGHLNTSATQLEGFTNTNKQKPKLLANTVAWLDTWQKEFR